MGLADLSTAPARAALSALTQSDDTLRFRRGAHRHGSPRAPEPSDGRRSQPESDSRHLVVVGTCEPPESRPEWQSGGGPVSLGRQRRPRLRDRHRDRGQPDRLHGAGAEPRDAEGARCHLDHGLLVGNVSPAYSRRSKPGQPGWLEISQGGGWNICNHYLDADRWFREVPRCRSC